MYKETSALKNKISASLSEILELKNSLRHKELEKQDLMKQFFLEVIDVIDSFENKENSLLEKNSENQENIKLINSFGIIKKRLLNLLAKYGVTKIEFPDNRLIVGFSKVMGTEPDQNKSNDTIISIVRNGYNRGHEVIREAEIIIVKN